ncbi:MAG: N-acetylmuramoyl-L-alanine amidase, partial [Pelagibacteraceae bacterium]
AKNFSKKQITKLFIKNLYKIGYRYFNKNSSYINPLIIKAFQRRFRQSKVNGLIDKETYLLSNYIVNKLKN